MKLTLSLRRINEVSISHVYIS